MEVEVESKSGSGASPVGLKDPDSFYAALVAMHSSLTEPECHRLNARLILLLADAVGDDKRVHALLREAALPLAR